MDFEELQDMYEVGAMLEHAMIHHGVSISAYGCTLERSNEKAVYVIKNGEEQENFYSLRMALDKMAETLHRIWLSNRYF